MKSLLYVFYCLLAAGLVSVPLGCVSQQKIALGSYQGDRIVWGKGGGVTGRVIEYVLLPTGQIFLREPFSQETKELTGTSAKTAEKLFQQIATTQLSFKEPGNMYQFLKLEGTAGVSKEAVWGRNQFTPPAPVQELYQQLQALIQP